MGRSKEKELFKFLPSEIINSIFLRLPVRSIAISKCVCKPWLHLLESDEFVNSHRERSTPCLAAMNLMITNGNGKRGIRTLGPNEEFSSRCNVYELEEEIDAHHIHHLTTFDFPQVVAALLGSANGLLLLHLEHEALYVCNPISREYINLNCPSFFFDEVWVDLWGYLGVDYGFGVCNVSGQYKVVRVMAFDDHCHVYTLGTGSWRRIEAAHDIALPAYGYSACFDPGAILNGILHWLVKEVDSTTLLISCFDLETECFSKFSHPPPVVVSSRRNDSVFTLRDCLCWCDQAFLEDGVTRTVDIWLMKEYGVEKSWTKEYVINFFTPDDFDTYRFKLVRPIKVFKDGDVLMQWSDDLLFYYSNKMKTTQQFGGPDDIYTRTSPLLFTPNFLSLKRFGMENVFSL